ncbi:MAG: metalloregulator ArsR/SmtB family transcription factor [Polyangia bacterium]
MRDELQRQAKLSAALAHPVRLWLLKRLLRGPAIVSALVEDLGIEQAAVSKHLGVLRQARVVRCSPLGRCRDYELIDPAATRRALNAIEALVPEQQDEVEQ